ncbi:MAG: KpsF/GutQ family sugar-phosphate isomerase [Acholeplasma sp.]|nr:KpsF/GutQ family sugar-phosphate isomerase [Acholeplasma sp.]
MRISNDSIDIIKAAKKVFDDEIQAINLVKEQIDENFIKALNIILKSKGKVIVIGIGKTGIIGKKLSASLSSTGTPSIFLNAAEASHGELGIIQANDIVVMITYSGSSHELIELIQPINHIGAKIITITGNKNSRIAQESHIVLSAHIQSEACPLNLAPTSSSTSILVLCDSIVVVLMKMRNFQSNDFAMFHPGGLLGRRLLTKVSDVMTPISKVGIGNVNDEISQITKLLTAFNLGIVLIKDEKRVTGIITDGDIRKYLSIDESSLENKAENIMTKDFITINYDMLAMDALTKMEKYKISCIPVKKENEFIGVIRFHDLYDLR